MGCWIMVVLVEGTRSVEGGEHLGGVSVLNETGAQDANSKRSS